MTSLMKGRRSEWGEEVSSETEHGDRLHEKHPSLCAPGRRRQGCRNSAQQRRGLDGELVGTAFAGKRRSPRRGFESGTKRHRRTQKREQVPVPVYHPTPSQTRLATQLTEEEQIRIAQRIGLIQHLPKGVYDPGRDGSEKKIRECVICMMDFVYGDPIRFLPCMHIYHLDCIDDWLMRSFTCPSCMEPVDAALLSSYETN
ncbi:PREDICTED: RING finger protein 11 [Chinchilla lanigera]|uniref:RING finger protein 11 n=1 Tax=Chinchilla lanigera TaxID=34839 RepID=UPI00038EE72C|nr:PREDICTED: RING finger protein 11 [Chinchilla lanigera]